ncbi:MAG: uroporphyrinogen-III C-methyltransferase [Syntrophobacterales bacterium]|jgi:uroporphyrinogen III methyltransferase/synthase|nr:uroporphyrinogen-III C-methyltransferase [Syntrophobacterales bacterium]
MGKIFLVGAGPGDPKLITVKGMELIRRADSIIYDYLANDSLLGFAGKGVELIYVGKQASRHAMSQGEINDLLARKAREKEIVVRLKGGDPYVFGRGGEEAVYLADLGIEFEIVPGVTSAISVPSYAGVPLTHREYASTVAFVTGHEDETKAGSTIKWHELALGVDTIVFLMGIKHLKEIKERLIEEGRAADTPACVIQWGTMPQQRVVTGPLKDIDALASKANIKPPGIIVVGDVVTLREKLKWFEKKPLFGKKIAVTRAPHQSMKLGELLTERGAEALYIATINIVPIKPNDRLREAIDRISKYFCIIFTSVNGASIFFDALFAQGMDARSLAGVKVLPIGTATAEFLESKGLMPDFIPKKFTSEGIIEVLEGKVKGRRFLLPRAEQARNVIAKFISDHGGLCDVIPVYRTTLPDNTELPAEKPDIVTFTSASTVENFITLFGKEMFETTSVASIGPITTETLTKHQVRVDIEASRYDIKGLVDAIVETVSRQMAEKST